MTTDIDALVERLGERAAKREKSVQDDAIRQRHDARTVNVEERLSWATIGTVPLIEVQAALVKITRLREALEPILNYPGIREYVGSILYDEARAALQGDA